MTGEPKSKSIKTKIMLGFSLVIFGVLFVGFVAYKSFNLLVDSIDQISEPNKKITLLNGIIGDLASADISMREWKIQADLRKLNEFNEFRAIINDRLDTLRTLSAGDTSVNNNINLIVDLLNEQAEEDDGLISLYKENRTKAIYNEAIKEITSKETVIPEYDVDSIENQDALFMDSTMQTVDSLVDQRLAKPKKGLFRSKKRQREDSIRREKEKSKTVEEIAKVIDGAMKSKEKDSALVLTQPSVVTDTVTKIISKFKAQDQRTQRQITQRELDVIEKNSKIITQVKGLISQMEAKEQKNHLEKTNKAENTANKAIFIIICTGILGTFSGIMFIYVLFNDITKRNFYRKLLVKAREKAINEGKAKEEFLANMSHEIRTPLNAILGFSDQLSKTNLGKRQSEYLTAVRSSSSHLLATVNDVLDFSKIQANKLSIEQIPFNLLNVIKDVYATLQLKAEQKNILLKYTFDEKLNQPLAGDPFRLKQILINLVNNGIKFTEQGHVELKASLEKDFKNKLIAKIEVNDTGIGIAEDKLNEVFRGFSQSDSSTTRKYGGTGLGLTISKKLVELQNGKLEVASKQGEGSSFIVNLTFKKEKEFKPLVPQKSISIKDKIFAGRKVIVIDDDGLNLQLVEIIFKKWGLKSDFNIDAKKAMASIEKNKYDLIITDIQMPEFSGIDVAKHVRTIDDNVIAATPILAFTANVMKDDIEKYLSSGINDYLLKPFREESLYNKIISILGLEIDNEDEGKNSKADSQDAKNEFQQGNDELYSLSEILQFTGERNESMLEVLESFVNSTNTSLLMMDSGLKNKDWDKVSMFAHKMLPSFSHLKVEKALPWLKTLERLNGNVNPTETQKLVQKVENHSKLLLKALRSEIISLKKELSAKTLQ